MKKLVLVATALLLSVCLGLTQDTIKLNTTSLYGITTKSWRYGLNLPIVSFKATDAANKPDQAYIGVLLLTDKEVRDLYAGIGLTVPFYTTKNITFTGTIGWWGGFSNIREPVGAEPGLGLGLTIKF